MTPEGKVKAHLKKRIKELGGELRFTKWIGRRSAPDCRVMFPGGKVVYIRDCETVLKKNCWVETKARDGVLSTGQVREIRRMQACGEVVLVLNTIELIDEAFPCP